MIYSKVQKDGKDIWIIKKKFAFAASAIVAGTAMAFRGLWVSVDATEVSLLLGAYGTFSAMVLGIVFAADVADKKLNGGHYHDHGEVE